MSILIGITDDLPTCRDLRRQVFVVEQQIAEEDEWDDLDHKAIHLLARHDGMPVGTARVIIDGDIGKIGRVCVLQPLRGTGLGRALMESSLNILRDRKLARAKIGSQLHAMPFYRDLGFEPDGPIYDDAGIPHRDMWRDL